ncbi:hypothetical protein L9F63_008894 [Diploptera punctata]|uniref:C2H2-type domain-containing protein n=1 Tax=Diploptera punctata TaxID=6984 RepID=A0AAD8E1M6_DIPPU|nr:hypothetical protein L9F63_008894 [Diploptera punctata]
MEFQAIKHEDGLIQTEIEPQEMRLEIKSEVVDEITSIDIKCETSSDLDPFGSQEVKHEDQFKNGWGLYYPTHCSQQYCDYFCSEQFVCFTVLQCIFHSLDFTALASCFVVTTMRSHVQLLVEENEESLDKLVENSEENATTFNPNVLLIEEDKCVGSTNNVVEMYSPSHHSKTRRKDDLGPHLNKVFKCAVCNRGFSDKSNCRRHERIHSKEEKLKSFKCDVCNKLFPYKSFLNKHILIHRSEKPFKCSVCNKAFRWESYFKIHIRVHINDKLFKCGVCNRAFSEMSYLKRHELVHSGDKRLKCFKCDHCDKLFPAKLNLRMHMNIHSSERALKCALCDNIYSNKFGLDRHMVIHSNVKAFKCSVCNKSFAHKSYLKSHVLTHNINEKAFQCPACISVGQKEDLESHLRIHNNEKAFKCRVCNKELRGPVR